MTMTITTRQTRLTNAGGFIALITLSLSTVPARGESARGNLLIIGGGLRAENAEIYEAFITLAGGKAKARIGVFPTASSTDLSARRVAQSLVRHGLPSGSVTVIDITGKNAAERAGDRVVLEQIRACTGLYIAGGDQRMVAQGLLGRDGRGTPALAVIREVYERGGVVAGSSAGAAVMGESMISASGDPIDTLDFGLAAASHHRGVLVSRGLGLFRAGVVDQHFNTRDCRLARLARSLVDRRIELGFGISEDTAMLVRAVGPVEILGPGGLTIVDASNATLRDGPLGVAISGLSLSYLERGDSYELAARACRIHPAKPRIKAGKESFADRKIVADLTQPDAVKCAITRGLVDNTAETQVGLLLTFDGDRGHGYRFTFSETERTRGHFGNVDGNPSYAAIAVQLDVRPTSALLDPPSWAAPLDPEPAASEEVLAVASRGILPTHRDGRSHADWPITRADFAAALVRATGLERRRDPDRTVSDVTPSSSHSANILAVVSAGLMDLDGGAFHPEAFVSRGEVTLALGRALRLGEAFCAIDLPRASAVSASLETASLVEMATMSIAPTAARTDDHDPATRGEVAKALSKFLGLSR